MEISKKELKEFYEAHTSEETGKWLGVSHVTLRKYLDRAGIKLKGSGNRNVKQKEKIVLL